MKADYSQSMHAYFSSYSHKEAFVELNAVNQALFERIRGRCGREFVRGREGGEGGVGCGHVAVSGLGISEALEYYGVY
jgi:hypothetical protein